MTTLYEPSVNEPPGRSPCATGHENEFNVSLSAHCKLVDLTSVR